MVFVSLASITLSFPTGPNLCCSFNIFKIFKKWGNGQDMLYLIEILCETVPKFCNNATFVNVNSVSIFYLKTKFHIIFKCNYKFTTKFHIHTHLSLLMYER